MNLLRCFCGVVYGATLLNLGLYGQESGVESSFDQNRGVFYSVPSDSEDSQEYSYSSSAKKFEDQLQGNSVIFETGATRVEVEAVVENTDFISQCRAQRQASQKKQSSHKSKSSAQDEEEDYSPKASVSVKWSSKDN